MVTTATLHSHPGDENTPGAQVVRISDPKRTGQQVQILMNIMTQCEHVLVQHAEIGDHLEVHKEAGEAAAKTYALAHEQMRTIIDDQERWSLNASEGDRYLERLAEAQHQVIQDQKENLALMRAPHRRYNTKLAFFPQVGWVCWYGESNPTDQTLNGIGLSPVEACAAFDELFLKRVPQQKPEAKKTATKRKKK